MNGAGLINLSQFRYKDYPHKKVALIHLERKRPWPSCPNPETGNQWSEDMKSKIVDIVSKGKFEVFRADQKTKVDDDPSLRQALNECMEASVDVIVAVQPVISDGRLAPVLAQQWGHCLILWATPEEQKGEMISGNSLVGSHLMTATLRQLGFPAQKTFGTLMLHIGTTEYVQLAKSMKKDVVQNDTDHVLNHLKLPFKALQTGFGVEEHELDQSSRHYLAMKTLIADNNLDALAIRCWPELPGPPESGGLDQWCYMALARLATEGFPIACEGDVDGALGCLIGKFLGCGTIYLSDWLEHDKETLTLWHGGMAPFQLSEAVGTRLGPCISRHFNNRKAGCLDATIRIGMEVTIFRFWVFNEQYHVVIMEGRTVKPKRHLLGNNGLVEFEADVDLINSFEVWLQRGFPHHICVVEGRQGKKMAAFAEQSNVKVLEKRLLA
ncbi:hypothetical protein TCAL_16408 [Tigriopus californicus]|uniref:L-fucose isomerase C-terminal domain-containing protein n=1 Tax=Tigriopus californicus TaxID=6832 RepID=A0A553NYA2_TIGCA|nr:hypothetical protein TCAL_16408 [Tigriopus californicus]